jgi:hypothetical protein
MYKEIVFKKWFVSLMYNSYEPLIGFAIGLKCFHLSIFQFTISIQKRV